MENDFADATHKRSGPIQEHPSFAHGPTFPTFKLSTMQHPLRIPDSDGLSWQIVLEQLGTRFWKDEYRQ